MPILLDEALVYNGYSFEGEGRDERWDKVQ